MPLIPAQNISFDKFKSYLMEATVNDSTISSNFVLKMKIYRAIYDMALIRNDKKNALSISNLISKDMSQWEDDIFQYWFGDKNSYLKELQEYESNRKLLIENLTKNLEEKKIAKIPHYDYFKSTETKDNYEQ